MAGLLLQKLLSMTTRPNPLALEHLIAENLPIPVAGLTNLGFFIIQTDNSIVTV